MLTRTRQPEKYNDTVSEEQFTRNICFFSLLYYHLTLIGYSTENKVQISNMDIP